MEDVRAQSKVIVGRSKNIKDLNNVWKPKSYIGLSKLPCTLLHKGSNYAPFTALQDTDSEPVEMSGQLKEENTIIYPLSN